MIAGTTGEPLSGGQIPRHGLCQPPARVRELARQLTPDERTEALIVMAIWSPEIFEKALQVISETRAIYAGWSA